MNNLLSIGTIFFLMVPVTWGQDIVTDIDGNVYQTVQIGNQIWMAENLKVTHYNNGDEITTGYSNSEWTNLSIGAYAVYDDDLSNANIYGNLYNWYAVDDSRNIAPEGWHVPSDEDWMELEIHLGMSQQEANDISFRGTDEGSQLADNADLWNDGDLEYNPVFGTTGLAAIPGGARIGGDADYIDMGNWGDYWSSTTYLWGAWVRNIAYYNSAVHRQICDKHYGFAVRCVRAVSSYTITVDFLSDWNLVGLPLEVEDSNYLTLFPNAIENTLFSFDDAYTPDSIMIEGEGYWLRFDSAGNTTIIGSTINELTISLNEGWNLISGISTTFDISDIQDPDGIIISGTVYGFTSDGYSNEGILEPGKGYWVRTNGSGSITLIDN
jgi:uncharacterized protein (TIGR02145 family)